jgi:hypothetical protein
MSMRMDSRSPFDRHLELLAPPEAPTPFEVELAAKLLAAERRATGSVTPSAARRSRTAPAAAVEETREERKQRIQKRLIQVYRCAPGLNPGVQVCIIAAQASEGRTQRGARIAARKCSGL